MARFVSNQKNFRVFLKIGPAGGIWADFSGSGEYETNNEEYKEKLRTVPNFGKDFFEVDHGKEKLKVASQPVGSGDLFRCPDCGKTESKAGKPYDRAVSVILHCRMEHKRRYITKDIEKVV